MHLTKKITDDLIWVGASDRRLSMFEGVYAVPQGVSYNSYLLLDKKTVLFDTVDRAVRERFLENVAFALDGRELDYIIIQHMEPDHSAAIPDLLTRYPSARLVVNSKTLTMLKQFTGFKEISRVMPVAEGDTLNTGRHTLSFIMAPMVHWPEVMVTFDKTDKTLFSADAFGCFGALNGALFADEVDFEREYMDEARRYYTNIVGKYGPQVQTLLQKAAKLEIQTICPLHGFVWRRGLSGITDKYALWAAYEPERHGVLVAYASVYGNTENAAEILASRLRDAGVQTAMYDVSVTPAPYILAEAFKYSHIVFASTTYNAHMFVAMDNLIADLTAHNIQNKTVSIIENGSWAPTSGSLIKKELEQCKNITFLGDVITLKSGVKKDTLTAVEKLSKEIAASVLDASAAATAAKAAIAFTAGVAAPRPKTIPSSVDPSALFKLTYGLFVLMAKDDIDNGCIINTATQIASRTGDKTIISIAVNNANYTCEMIKNTGVFTLSVLSEAAPFSVFKRFGFKSGHDLDKFDGAPHAETRAQNGVRFICEFTNAAFAASVVDKYDYGSHTLFIAELTEAAVLTDIPSMTYAYYFANVKPKPKLPETAKTGFVCKICAYVHEGDTLPADFICPLCKHPAADFIKL